MGSMEKRKKSKDSKSSKQVLAEPKMRFDEFFQRAVASGKVQSWQYKEISAFFADLKLSPKEDLEIFEAALARY